MDVCVCVFMHECVTLHCTQHGVKLITKANAAPQTKTKTNAKAKAKKKQNPRECEERPKALP